MLSDEVMNKISERFVRRIENLNIYIIKQIGEAIKKIGKLTPTEAMQIEAILKYGGSFDKITQEIAKITRLNIKDVYDIYEKLAIQDQNFAKVFYEYRNIDYIPYKENIALQRHVNSLAKLTADKFVNYSSTEMLGYGFQDSNGRIIYKNLKKAYYDIIDEAILSVSEGKETFNERMYKIIKEIGDSGLKVIYPTTYQTVDKQTGNIITKHYARRLDSVVRMNIQDGIGQLHNANQELFGNEFGSDGVEITVHENSAPDHEPVQGRQFSTIRENENELSEWEKLQAGEDAKDYKGNTYNLNHDGKGGYRPISKMNCRHVTYNIVLGISNPAYTEEELQKAKERNNEGFDYEGKHYTLYEGEQLQRNIELELRKAKDAQIMGRTSGIKEDVMNAQQRITQLTNKYKELLNASGLDSKLDRARVPGYKRVNVKNLK